MRRVVVTGMGAATPIGNIRSYADQMLVTEALLNGTVGITSDETFAENGFKAPYSGRVSGLTEWTDEVLSSDKDKLTRKFMGKGDTLALALLPAIAAVASADLSPELLGKTAVFVGPGGPSTQDQVEAGIILKEMQKARKIDPFSVPPTMSSGQSAIISTYLGAGGGAISLTSACATGTHNIGHGYQQIAFGVRDITIVGGADDCHVTKAAGFEAMRKALYAGELLPEQASRPFDTRRKGFIDAAGGGVLVLEELEHALKRKARIFAEIVGFSYTSDGGSMTSPNGKGAVRAMREALRMAKFPHIDYVNAHGTSTPDGDPMEMWALNEVFGDKKPIVTSTKAQVGHSLGGSGAVEAIFTILMMRAGKVGAQVNLDELDPKIAELGWAPFIPTKTIKYNIDYAMSNSFGFGGTNGTLVFRNWKVEH